MTFTLDLPPEVEQAWLAQAEARGLPLAEVLREVLVSEQPFATSDAEMGPEEWVRQFREWTRSHTAEDLPLLSDEAISREFIYGDRGL